MFKSEYIGRRTLFKNIYVKLVLLYFYARFHILRGCLHNAGHSVHDSSNHYFNNYFAKHIQSTRQVQKHPKFKCSKNN